MFFGLEEVKEGSGLLPILIVLESLALEEKDFLSERTEVIFVVEDDFSSFLAGFLRIARSRIHASCSLSILQNVYPSN